MFELFIALFGGIYYIVKILCKQSQEINYVTKASDRQNTRISLMSKLCLDSKEEFAIQNYILSGEHFDEICDKFEEDFQFVFGEDWRNKLIIPPKPPILNPKIYKRDAYSFITPCNHITWVFRLILASMGKVSSEMFSQMGYACGGDRDQEMCTKFAQRIEMRLRESGVNDIYLMQELRCSDIFGQSIKIRELCTYPSCRPW